MSFSSMLKQGWWLAVLPIVLTLEILYLSLIVDPYQAVTASSSEYGDFLQYLGAIVKLIIAAAILFVISLVGRLKAYLVGLFSQPHVSRFRWALVHLVLYGLLIQTSVQLESSGYTGSVVAWLFLGAAVGITWAAWFAPTGFWLQLIAAEWSKLLTALVVAFIALMLANYTESLWTVMSDATFQLSYWFLSLISDDVVVQPAEKILGAGDFKVNIAPECSGFEGIGLIVTFIAVYLYYYRDHLYIGRALLLFPVGALLIWLLNSVRIALLVKIGQSWSQDIAVGGFHSQAGWIFFILTSLAVLQLSRLSFFGRKAWTDNDSAVNYDHLPFATLAPLVMLLASTLLTAALSADVNWFYPFKVIATAAVLAWFWRLYGLLPASWRFEPVLAGIVVAVMWFFLVPENAEGNRVLESAMASQPVLYVLAWFVFRFIGSAVVVPLAEELGFRAYLYSRIAGIDVITKGRVPFNLLAAVISSIAFGLLHGDWLAGTIAGMIFMWVRLRSDTIWDAIIAHAVANALLFAVAVNTGYWHLL